VGQVRAVFINWRRNCLPAFPFLLSACGLLVLELFATCSLALEVSDEQPRTCERNEQ